MRFKILLIIALIFSFCLPSCQNDEPEPQEQEVNNVLLMYFPWSTSLTHNFRDNISDMERAIREAEPESQRVVVFFAKSESEASMYELKLDKGIISHKTVAEYPTINTTTSEGIQTVLEDMKRFFPAKEYSMIVGAHGMGWLPVNKTRSKVLKYYWENKDSQPTRFFGGLTPNTQTDISTFKDAILACNLKFEFIYFDVCYMSNIETAYELKETTNHIIASTSEIMSYGTPFAIVGKYMFGTPDYNAICDGFYNYYAHNYMPYGTMATIDCSKLDKLATTMRQINSQYQFNQEKAGNVQILDGYTPPIFYDLGSYVENLCEDKILLGKFKTDLDEVIIKKVNTSQIYSMSKGPIKVKTFSGITISDLSKNPSVKDFTETSWYKATH